MTHATETIEYKNHTIEIHYDDHHDIEIAIGDEPIMIIDFDGWNRANVIYDGSKNSLPQNIYVIRAIQDCDSQSLADELGFDIWKTEKRFAFDSKYQEPRYYKTVESRYRAMLQHDELQNVKIESVSTQDGNVYIVYDQLELDQYAGMKNAKPPIESVQAYFDGDVYGFVIDDYEDSCWGFIGDIEYCISEAKSIVDHMVNREREKRIARLKEMIRNHVPLYIREMELST